MKNIEHFKKYRHPKPKKNFSPDHPTHSFNSTPHSYHSTPHSSPYSSHSISSPSSHSYHSTPSPQPKPSNYVCENQACRYNNIKFLGKCKYIHTTVPSPTKNATFSLDDVHPAKHSEIKDKFAASFPGATFHSVKKINNSTIYNLFTIRQEQIRQKRKGLPPHDLELYHGTDHNIIDQIMKSGFSLPADYEGDPNCPTSSKRVGKTSLCDINCKLCTQHPHKWNQCHMYGLGIYFADLAKKSNGYVTNTPTGAKKKMLLCRVELGHSEKIDKDLTNPDERHNQYLPKHTYDSITVEGHQNPSKQLGVINNEYIIFHPYQAFAEYLIEYTG